MIDLDVINKDILELETMHDTTWNVVERLAWLYTVKNHFEQASVPESKTVSGSGESDFLKAIAGKDDCRMWAVMDELMECLAAIQPTLYNSVMQKIIDEK